MAPAAVPGLTQSERSVDVTDEQIVLDIVGLYLAGLTAEQIAERFNHAGVPILRRTRRRRSAQEHANPTCRPGAVGSS